MIKSLITASTIFLNKAKGVLAVYYTPVKFEILEFNIDGVKIRKVFASWYGDYLYSDNWRLSSGIVDVVEEDEYLLIKNISGSIYKVREDSVGMSPYASEVLQSWIKQTKSRPNTSIEIVTSEYV